MKKIMLLMMAALAITTISCKKDNKGGDDEEGTIAKPTYRVKSYTHGKDFFNYSWNADGTIAKVELGYDGSVYSIYAFTWNAGTVSVVDQKADNKPIATITVNDQKLATKIVQPGESELSKKKLIECSYDANGFLTLAKVDGTVNTVQVIDEDGNIEWWGRVGIAEQVTASTTATGWRRKMHTYYGTVNAAGIHGEWDEDVTAKRWFYETGLLGRASANIMRTAWWWGIVNDDKTAVNPEYAPKLAYYPLDVDANNCVKKETKLYDTKEKYEADPSTMGLDDAYEFVCEKIQ